MRVNSFQWLRRIVVALINNFKGNEEIKEWVGSESLKASKQQNPFTKKKSDVYPSDESYDYVSSDGRSKRMRDVSNEHRESTQGRLSNSSNLRSTLPLSPFYGKFIENVKLRRLMLVKQDLYEFKNRFFQPIDEMNKTALHWAWEK